MFEDGIRPGCSLRVSACRQRDALLAAAKELEAEVAEEDQYGRCYLVVDFPVERAGKRAMVRSTWIIRQGEDFPRLTSCYVL
jgi:hypothetical protein